MKPTDYPNSLEIASYELNDDLIELIGEREACIGYEFTEGDKHWGERDNLAVSLFARFKGDEYECLDHLLSEEDQNEIEILVMQELEREAKEWNQP